MARACLIIGPTTIIGPGAIIGDSCAGFPIWDVDCGHVDLAADTNGAASLPDQVCQTVTLSEPTEKVVV